MNSFPRFCTGSSAIAMLCVALMTQPAEARRNGAGLAIGIGAAAIIGGAILNDAARAMNQKPQAKPSRPSGGGGSRKPKDDDDDDDDVKASSSSSSNKKDAKSAKLVLTPQEIEQADLLDRTRREDRLRNVDAQARDFMGLLKLWHLYRRWDQKNEEAVKIASEVTDADVRRSLDDAYSSEGLAEFAQFEGEPWSKDRVQVRVLTEAQKALPNYFNGVGARGPNAAEISQVIRNAARTVFAQILEQSEMLGVTASHDRLMQRAFEHGNSQEGASLQQAAASQKLDKIASIALIEVASRPVQDREAFALRLRARRVVYDCMAEGLSDAAQLAGGVQQPRLGDQLQREATRQTGVSRVSTKSGSVTIEDTREPAEPRTADVTADAVVLLHGYVRQQCMRSVARLYERIASDRQMAPAPAAADWYNGEPNWNGQIWQASFKR